jgi:DNA-binding PadR family transcriptional regulator
LGFGFGPWEWWWSAGGPRRRRQWFEAGDMKYVILKLLKEKPMHGYEVMKALEEHTHGCYKPSPGAVYPTLQWLEDEGLVQSEVIEGKKVYRITQAGLQFLEQHKSTVEGIFDRVGEMIGRLVGDPMPEISCAVGKVVAQAYRTSWKLGTDEARKRRVIEILEGAARELEKLAR